MLLPDNIHPENSIYYNGALILQILIRKKKVDMLDLYQEINSEYSMNFSVFVLCLDWLYLINAANLEKGKIELCS